MLQFFFWCQVLSKTSRDIALDMEVDMAQICSHFVMSSLWGLPCGHVAMVGVMPGGLHCLFPFLSS